MSFIIYLNNFPLLLIPFHLFFLSVYGLIIISNYEFFVTIIVSSVLTAPKTPGPIARLRPAVEKAEPKTAVQEKEKDVPVMTERKTVYSIIDSNLNETLLEQVSNISFKTKYMYSTCTELMLRLK